MYNPRFNRKLEKRLDDLKKQQLPAWYIRFLRITVEEDREILDREFDEDISDFDECECDEVDCECESLSDDDDTMSKRSYDGADCAYYYKLKDQREYRKRELQRMERLTEKAQRKEYALEAKKEEEVQSVYDSLKKIGKERKTVSREPIAIAGHFNLHSTDHVNHCYDLSYYPTKYIEFYYLDESGESILDLEARQKAKQIYGHIYFDGSCDYSFTWFSPPKHASLDSHTLERDEGKDGLTIQFLSNDYLKLKVASQLDFNHKPQPQDVPEFFEFVGIRLDVKKERERRMASAKRKRTPSPRDSWFERTHPMGS